MKTGPPAESCFPEELRDQWYVKYMDFLYGNGYLDLESCPAAEETALADVTYGELAGLGQRRFGVRPGERTEL